MEDLRKRIMKSKVGQKLRVRFQRESDIFEVYIELMAAPE